MPQPLLRDYRSWDADAIDAVARAAFVPLLAHYDDPAAMARRVSHMSALAVHGEIILADDAPEIIGGIVHVPPGQPKADIFDPAWSVIRMLVVDPAHHGRGLGRALTEACLVRARRDGASRIALHTTPIMSVALGLYLRLGFERLADAPPILGVPYGVYVKDLTRD